MVTKVTSSNFSSSVTNILTAAASLPTITNVQPTTSSYAVSGLAVLDPATTSYVKISGTNFAPTTQVFIESTLATTVTYVSSTQLNVVLPSKSTGSYVLYVVNPDGSVAIRINAVTYSTSPVWSTTSLLPGSTTGSMISIQLAATSDSSVVYTVTDGSLPTGLSLSTSGLLSGIVTGLSTTTTYNFTVTATDVENQTNNSSFSITITANDPFWSLTTLMINNETASTPFTNDASTNSFQLSINGDAKSNKFSPFYVDGYYSYYFGGNDYFTVPASVSWACASDFTVECWINVPPTRASYYTIINQYTASGGTSFELQTNGTFLIYYTGTTNFATTAITEGRWNHIALSRTGSTLTFYINGVSAGSATYSGTYGDSTTALYIGMQNYASSGKITGYVSNLRYVKGTAVYTSVFTPSTTPLTAVTNTQLLTCQSNKIVDKSTNAAVITATGTAISPAIPFAANSSYATYGSAYFDGIGDYLATPTSSAFQFGTGDFTIECWAYLTTLGSYNGVFDSRNLGSADGVSLTIFSSGAIEIGINVTYVNGGTFTTNQWHHLAYTRASNTVRAFLNGVQVVTGTISNNVQANYALIGKTNDGWHCTGYISNVRVLKGTAQYTSNFTPSITPLTSITNTQLLSLQYNGSATNNEFSDQSGFNNVITRAGNATQGSFSPYSPSGWSTYFDGASTQYFTLPTAAATAFGGFNGNYTTIEFWAFQTTTSTTATNEVLGTWAAVAANGRFYIEIGNGAASTGAASKVFFTWTTSTGTVDSVITTAVVPVNQWAHIAIVVNATGSAGAHTVNIYVNGSGQSFTARDFSSQTTTYDRLRIGGNSSTYFYGYLNNLRVVRSATNIVGYTGSNISVPTSPFAPAVGTILLTFQTNNFIDNSPNSIVLTPASTPSIQAFVPFSGISSVPTSYSVYVDGTGDYLQLTEPSATTGDVTVECWVYPTSTTARGFVVSAGSSGTGAWAFSVTASNTIEVWLDGYGAPKYTSTLTVADFAWSHIALVKASGVVKLYVNGVLETANASQVGNFGYPSASSIFIGVYSVSLNQLFTGYISNFRYVQGTALYSGSSFTVPTSPLTAVSGTKVLTCQSSTMIDNSTNYYAITAFGDTKPKIFNPFGATASIAVGYSPTTHGGSIYYDGTGDYLTSPTKPLFAFGASKDFTAECWVYFTTLNASQSPGIISVANASSSTGWQIYADSNNGWGVRSNAANVFSVTNPPKVNQWYHVAYVRKSGVHALYVNGVLNTATVSTSYTWSDQVFYTGYTPIGNNVYGYVSDVRLVNGTALYTSNFIPPTLAMSPTVTIGSSTYNAVLLLNGTNGSVVDAHGSTNIETIGNAQISTAIKKYGTASMYFDGSGDRLMTTSGPTNSLGSGDFTIEFWIYSITLPANARLLSQGSYTTGEYLFIVYSSGAADFCEATTARLSFPASSFVTATWQHIAIVRSGTTIKGYVNGTSVATATSTYNYSAITNTYIGSNPNTASQDFNGYLDELRITKYARYTSNFTAPTSAFITK
jgi:hypothetical protein